MKYYKLISSDNCYANRCIIGNIYPGELLPKNWDHTIEYHAINYPEDWIEVTPGEYFVQEGIMPKYFAIKRVEDNSLWKQYISWLNEKYNGNYEEDTYCYYGFDGRREYHSYIKAFKNNPIELTLEQWDKIINKNMKEEFVLPKFWQINRNKDNYKIVNDWMNTWHGLSIADQYRYEDSFGFVNNKNTHKRSDITLSEITTEQFIKYVLKQPVMKEDKEIVGYKLKDLTYVDAVTAITKLAYPIIDNIFKLDSYSHSIAKLQRAGVLELWFEPVYKSKTLQFGGYDVTFEKVTSGVRITCNNETGTLSQVEEIHNRFNCSRWDYKFGSQNVKEVIYPNGHWDLGVKITAPTSIKIGCTTGTWEEFAAIYEKAKSM